LQIGLDRLPRIRSAPPPTHTHAHREGRCRPRPWPRPVEPPTGLRTTTHQNPGAFPDIRCTPSSLGGDAASGRPNTRTTTPSRPLSHPIDPRKSWGSIRQGGEGCEVTPGHTVRKARGGPPSNNTKTFMGEGSLKKMNVLFEKRERWG